MLLFLLSSRKQVRRNNYLCYVSSEWSQLFNFYHYGEVFVWTGP